MRAAPFAPPHSIGTLAWPWLLSIAAMLAAIVVIGGGGLTGLVNWWQTPEGSHGWVIPFVAGFILWQRRHLFISMEAKPSWAGVAFIVLGVLVLMVDEITQLHRAGVLALVMIALGGTLAALGWHAARIAAVPLALLLFAMPPPAPLYVELSLQLQFISSALGAAILRLMGVTVFLDGNVIDLGVFRVQVVEACSGLRYLFPLSFFAFLCAWIYKAPYWAKTVVLLSVIPITIITNSARIALTGILVQHFSVAHAEGFMHLFEGWVIFIVALAMLAATMWLLARLRGVKGGLPAVLDFPRLAGAHISVRQTGDRPQRGVQVMGLPLPWLASVAIVLAAVPAHAAWMNREQIIPERPGLVTFPIQLGEWRGQPSTIDAQIEQALRTSDYFLGDFVRASGGGVVNLWVAYHDSQVRDAAPHNPAACLPGAGWEFLSLRPIPSPVTNARGEDFQLNRARITNHRHDMLVYYWLEARGRQFHQARSFKIDNVRTALFDRRSDGALVRLITPIEPGETEAEAEGRLIEFMRVAYPALEPHIGL